MNDTTPNEGEFHLLDFLILFAKHSQAHNFCQCGGDGTGLFGPLYYANKYTATARLLPPSKT